MSHTPEPRLIVGLDLPSSREALRLVDQMPEEVVVYKIGLTLLAQDGVQLAGELRARGKQVFQDWKLHDIGAQVEGAAASVSQGPCDILTVHAEPQVMAAAVAGRAPGSHLKIIGVTVMTSLSEADLIEIGSNLGVEALIERRVRQALSAGLDGVVSSPLEAARIRQIALEAGHPNFLIVTPGVRPKGADLNDQQRAATPTLALQAGATHLVVARPIIAAPDPRGAAYAILDEMARAV